MKSNRRKSSKGVSQKAAKIKLVLKRLADVQEHEANPRDHPPKGTPEWEALRASLTNCYFDPMIYNRRNGKLVGGAYRWKILQDEGYTHADMSEVDLSEEDHIALMIAANEAAGHNDDAKLLTLLKLIQAGTVRADLSGLTEARLKELLALSQPVEDHPDATKLVDRFGVPPFTVLDARQGYWQDRKRSWLALGMQSEIGRGGNLLARSLHERVAMLTKGTKYSDVKSFIDAQRKAGLSDVEIEAKAMAMKAGGAQTGTSIFDPVLCEMAYRWFCPPGGRILDPFAGGSVRGIVAAWLGRDYVGIDLRAEQVAANRQQWEAIASKAGTISPSHPVISDSGAPTPVQAIDGYFFKRDDYFQFGGANGGKVRAMIKLAEGAKGIITCGDRLSTQIPRAALVAKALGLPCRIHTAKGPFTPGMSEAKAAGAVILQHGPGRLSQVKAEAKKDAAKEGFTLIPWGLEHPEAPELTATQVQPIPKTAKRIVVPVGSGMTLCGILKAIARKDAPPLPILGVVLGGNVEKRLDEYAPVNWRDMVKLIKSKQEYHAEAPAADQNFHGVPLDPIYEAKCVPFLKPGDLLWIVGRRSDPPAAPKNKGKPEWVVGDSVVELDDAFDKREKFDFVWTCPPYGSLERYSDNPADLSTMTYEKFIEALELIVAKACARLKDNRFAGIVIGDIRDKDGIYRNFVSHTIEAFRLAGMKLYNEAILVTAVGSLPLRIGKMFNGSRKLGKAHQQCLIFVKGDPKKATQAIGEVEFGEIEAPDLEKADA